jgi:cyclic pyranopterin phosphate synthase
MPSEGVQLKPRAEILTYEEIIRLARLLVGSGVRKIRLTGGEPLVRKDVFDLIGGLDRLRDVGLEVLAMTTNGIPLAGRVADIKRLGIDHLNISLDTLNPERYQEITRRKGLERVLQAINEAVRAGYDPVKVNCVVMRGINDDELVDFVALTQELPVEVRFIEYMPFDENGWHSERLVPYVEMLKKIRESISLEPVRVDETAVAKVFRVEGFRGTVGFISSMTDNFCSGCSRLRITADGHLKVCLFGPAEVSLRDAMRSGATDDELRSVIRDAVMRKHASHAGMEVISQTANRPMVLIGG